VKRNVLPAVAAVALSISISNAQDRARTGGELLRDCAGIETLGETTAPIDRRVAALSCVNYIEGFVEGHDSVAAITRPAARRWFCLPKGVTIYQVASVVRKFLQDHPERLHERAAILTGVALLRAFPCK
jgi:hypothetical protein